MQESSKASAVARWRISNSRQFLCLYWVIELDDCFYFILEALFLHEPNGQAKG
jgi:hypothetical protein